MNLRRIIDIFMTIALLLLMSIQVTDNEIHEYIGMVMIALVIWHQYLNRKWFTTLFKGKYGAVRILSLAINISLITAFILSALSGIIISETFLFLNTEELTEWGRVTHICSSYWSFVLMGLHVGMHWGMIAGKVKVNWLKVLAIIFAGYGMYRFIIAKIFDYITLRSYFVFLDYDKFSLLVIIENIAMLAFCTLLGYQLSKITAKPKESLKPALTLAGTSVICAALILLFGGPETF